MAMIFGGMLALLCGLLACAAAVYGILDIVGDYVHRVLDPHGKFTFPWLMYLVISGAVFGALVLTFLGVLILWQAQHP